MRVRRICGVTAAAVCLSANPTDAHASAPVRTVAQVAVAAPDASADEARALYDDGRRYYRRGRFREALEKFEAAYDLSEQPLLLYNIALASRQLYDVAQDIEELRRARAVLKNFLLFADRDAGLDGGDAKKLLTEIELLIEAHKAGNPAPGPSPEPGPEPGPDPEPLKTPPTGEDPGRKLRLIGGGVMGGGGALFVGGLVAGIVFSLKGKEFNSTLTRLTSENAEVCGEGDEDSVDCRQNESDSQVATDNGNAANIGAGVSFGIGGGLGAIAIATGAVLFIQGNKRSKEWKAGGATTGRIPPRVHVGPSWSRSGMGIRIQGRF